MGATLMREQEKLSAREVVTSTARIMTLCLLVVALSTQARAESGQYKIRSLDLNNPADQEMLIRMLDPNGAANRDELIRTAIDLDKRFRAPISISRPPGSNRSTTRHQTTSISQ